MILQDKCVTTVVGKETPDMRSYYTKQLQMNITDIFQCFSFLVESIFKIQWSYNI